MPVHRAVLRAASRKPDVPKYLDLDNETATGSTCCGRQGKATTQSIGTEDGERSNNLAHACTFNQRRIDTLNGRDVPEDPSQDYRPLRAEKNSVRVSNLTLFVNLSCHDLEGV